MEKSSSLRLWVILNRTVRSVEDALREQVEARGLSMTEFAVLEVLLHKGALPIGEIGDRVLRTSGSMTYILDKLARRGLLRRRACEEDRRVQYAELTDDGRALIEAVYKVADDNATPTVYWMTQEFNHTARRLYDKVANVTPFIKYTR